MRDRMTFLGSRSGWTSELFVMFVAGFVAATMLWLALWLFQTRPAQVSAIEAKETALQKCVATKQLCDVLRNKVQAENEEVSNKLEEALLGWGRCIRSQSTASSDAAESAQEEGTN